MIAHFRNSISIKVFWTLIAIYLLNISVDTTDPAPQSVTEDLAINDQESLVEIVVEEILGFENAIHENDDPDTENNFKKNNLKIELGTHAPLNLLSTSFSEACNHLLPHVKTGLTAGFLQLNTPPPKS